MKRKNDRDGGSPSRPREVLRAVAVDWSGARDGERRAIWLAEAVAGRLVRLECGRSREELVVHLLDEAARDPGLVVGLDFAFSLPEWFLRARGVDDVAGAWELVAREGEAWLADPQPPFWRERKPPGNGFRRTELECGGRPKSVFQLVGAGQVGAGSLRGMPFLRRLRERFAIWPFDEPQLPLLVEIYPRLHLGLERVDRSFQTDARAEPARPDGRHRERCLGAVGDGGYPNEHARDAAASALAMSRRPGDWHRLPRDPGYALEGRIWHEGLVLRGG